MLSIARCCTKVMSRTNATSSYRIGRSSFVNAPKKVAVNNGSILLRQIPIHIGKVKRRITQTGTIAFGYTSKVDSKAKKIVGKWMIICGSMVFVAVALGGVTRLTESGLSMVNWKLLGESMPITEAQWIEEFERYMQFPEFKITNKNMTLKEFKRIWWMEYAHRMWGRLIGVVFVLPATYFWAKGFLNTRMKVRVGVLGSLIGLQGLMGWYMVKSGLEDRFDGPSDVPRVSQYRLAAHLGMALLLYTGFLYSAFECLIPAQKLMNDYFSTRTMKFGVTKKHRMIRMMAHSVKGLTFLTALSGAFVAGMDAGLIYNTFPKMADKWIPDEILALSPVIRNFTENPTTVQFDHRIMGILTLTSIATVWITSSKIKLPGRGKAAVIAVVLAGNAQVLLGVMTLVNHVQIKLAALHQSGSLVLLTAATWLCHELKHFKKFPK